MSNIIVDKYIPIVDPMSNYASQNRISWLNELLSNKEDRINQLRNFLTDNSLNQKPELDDFKELSSFIKLNLETNGYDLPSKLWASVLIDLGLYVGEYKRKLHKEISWQYAVENNKESVKTSREVVLIVNGKKVAIVKDVLFWAFGILDSVKIPEHIPGIDWIIAKQIDRHINPKSIERNYLGFYPKNLEKENTKPILDSQYDINLELRPLLIPITDPTSDQINNFKFLSPPEMKSLFLKIKDKKFVAKRVEGFDSWLSQHEIKINPAVDDYEEFDNYYRTHISRSNDKEMGPFTPSNYWISIWIDFILYVVEEKKKQFPKLRWQASKTGYSVGFIYLINRDSFIKKLHKIGMNLFWQTFREVVIEELNFETGGMTTTESLHSNLSLRVLGPVPPTVIFKGYSTDEDD